MRKSNTCGTASIPQLKSSLQATYSCDLFSYTFNNEKVIFFLAKIG